MRIQRRHRADAWKRDDSSARTVQVVKLEHRVGVPHTVNDEPVIDTAKIDQLIERLTNERRPVVLVGRVDVDSDDTRVRRRPDKEHGAPIPDELIDRVARVEELHDGSVEVRPLGIVEVDEIQTILQVEAVARRDDEILPIVADVRAQLPARVLRALEHQAVI